MSPQPVRVLVVDDDDLMRAGLKAVLSSDDAIEVVGKAGDGLAAVSEARARRADCRRPHAGRRRLARIDESTVKTHVRRILMKLRLRDRVQAVIFAYESGLSSPGSRFPV